MMRHELGKWNLDELVKNPTRAIFDKKLAKIESTAKRFEKILSLPAFYQKLP
jgi:oligoendopeptidase F